MSSKIRYKVVRADGTSAIINNPDYETFYEKGKIVTAKEGTLGIFCFKRKKDAKNFAVYGDIILRVLPLSRGKVPQKIFDPIQLTAAYKEFNLNGMKMFDLYDNRYLIESLIPQGTICYQKIIVLD